MRVTLIIARRVALHSGGLFSVEHAGISVVSGPFEVDVLVWVRDLVAREREPLLHVVVETDDGVRVRERRLPLPAPSPASAPVAHVLRFHGPLRAGRYWLRALLDEHELERQLLTSLGEAKVPTPSDRAS